MSVTAIAKLTAVGKPAVGKTCLLITYVRKAFPEDYIPTVFDEHKASVTVDYKKIKTVELALLDTYCQSDYDMLRPGTYGGTDVWLIVYSISDPQSLEDAVERWWPEIKWHYGHCPHPTLAEHFAAQRAKQGKPPEKLKPKPISPIILVATKTDLRDDPNTLEKLSAKGLKPVTTAEGEAAAKKIGAVKFIECSALKQENVDTVFDEAIKALLLYREGPIESKKAPSSKKAGLSLPPISKGTVTMELKKAVNLIAADHNGFSDPYVSVHAYTKDAKRDGKLFVKTAVIKKTLNPEWNAKVHFQVDPEKLKGTDGLAVQVWDWNIGLHNSFLGEVRVE